MKLFNADCLDVLPTLPDNSVDLILTDPPYFKVKKEKWDRQWNDPEAFLSWLDEVAAQWQRVLKPNGSLYCFASPRMAARVEVMLGARFNVLNNIRWIKNDNGTRRHDAQIVNKDLARSYFPDWESIIFCEHYGADNIAKGEAGYGAKCDELRGFVFASIADYLKSERDKAGWQNEDAKRAVGHSPSSGCHWFDRSQWTLPTQKIYETWQAKAPGYFTRPYDDLRQEYEDLRREYEDLRREYEHLRRPFNVSADVPYTDVWTFATVKPYPNKHPCEKPQDLLRHIITASSREGAIVLDSFMGTGSAALACMDTGRNFIGIELGREYYDIAQQRISEAQQAQRLFTAAD